MVVVVISGTPGVGKSRLGKWLAKELKWFRLDVGGHYKEISTSYNQSKKCYEIDFKKFEILVRNIVKGHGDVVVDSHVAHLLSRRIVDLCIVLVCSDLKKLRGRLVRRGYSKQKVRENLDAEIFGVCLAEAKEKCHKVVVIDISKGVDKEKVLRRVTKSL